MDLKVIHDTILYFLNKEQNAFATHQEIDLVLDKAQLVLFNQYHANPKMPAAQQPSLYGESQRIDDALSPFKEKYTFNNVDTPTGVITLPANFLHLTSLYTTTYNSTLSRNIYSAVQVLNEEELIQRLESQVIPVTPDDPIAIMNKQNKIQLFPEVPSTGGVFYLRRPAVPFYSYTQTGRTVTYTQASSTQMEWRDSDIQNIIIIALSYYGLNMSSADLVQFSQVKEAQGQ